MTKEDFFTAHAPDLDFEKNEDELIAYGLKVGFIYEVEKGRYEYGTYAYNENVVPVLS